MQATKPKAHASRKRGRKPIINRPITWAKMSDGQRKQACEAVRDESWYREEHPRQDRQ